MQNDEEMLRHCFELARRARERGDHPFGALLLTAEGEEIEGMNAVESEGDPSAHAELRVLQSAARKLGPQQLKGATLYSSAEPCAMCGGAIYWSGVRRVVYGLDELALAQATGRDQRNLTLDLPLRELFARGQRTIEVVGPMLIEEALEVHRAFWKC